MIDLNKGGSICLTKEDKGLEYVRIGLGWDPTITKKVLGLKVPVHADVDIDSTILVYDANNKCTGECSYRRLRLEENGEILVRHHGDERSGGKKGDDETIDVHLDKLLGTKAQKAYVVLNVYSPRIDFDAIQNAYVRVYDKDKNVLANYNLTDDYENKNGIIVGKFERNNNSWKFIALGDGVRTSGIESLKTQSLHY